jgi:hypothetical protein
MSTQFYTEDRQATSQQSSQGNSEAAIADVCGRAAVRIGRAAGKGSA